MGRLLRAHEQTCGSISTPLEGNNEGAAS